MSDAMDDYKILLSITAVCEALEKGAVWATNQGGDYAITVAPLRELASDLTCGQRPFVTGLKWSPAAPWSTAVLIAEKYGVDVFAALGSAPCS